MSTKISAKTIVQFLMDEVHRLESAHRAIKEDLKDDHLAGTVLQTGLLTHLATVEEALNRAVTLEPALDAVRAKHLARLRLWRQFRDDADHAADRLFGPTRPEANDPRTGSSIMVVHYERQSDEVRTGTSATLKLGDAIAVARMLVEEAMTVVGIADPLPATPAPFRPHKALGLTAIKRVD